MPELQWNLLSQDAPAKAAASFDPIGAYDRLQAVKMNALTAKKAKMAMGDEEAYRNALAEQGLNPGIVKMQKDQQAFDKVELEKVSKQFSVMKEAADRVASAPPGQATKWAVEHTIELGKLFGKSEQEVMQDLQSIKQRMDEGGDDAVREDARMLSMDVKDKLQKIEMVNLQDRYVPVQTNAYAPGYNARELQMGMSPAAAASNQLGQANLALRKQELAQKKLEATQPKADNPYFMPIQAPQGIVSFDTRKGTLSQPTLNGAPVIGTVSDPAVQAKIAQAKETGGEIGKLDIKQYEAASTAPVQVENLDRLLKQLETSDAITGMGAEIFNGIERAKALLGSEAAAGKVKDTELLDVMMGSEVFPMIQSLGVGARGMDTPAERDYMRQVLTGRITLNKGTLVEMAKIRKNIAKRAVERWNKRVEKGELDRFFDSTGLEKQTFSLPETPKKSKTPPAGWVLMEDADGNKAYVSPDGTEFQEVE